MSVVEDLCLGRSIVQVPPCINVMEELVRLEQYLCSGTLDLELYLLLCSRTWGSILSPEPTRRSWHPNIMTFSQSGPFIRDACWSPLRVAHVCSWVVLWACVLPVELLEAHSPFISSCLCPFQFDSVSADMLFSKTCVSSVYITRFHATRLESPTQISPE